MTGSSTQGIKTVLHPVSDLTKAKAKAWTAHFPGFGDIKQEGDFARAY